MEQNRAQDAAPSSPDSAGPAREERREHRRRRIRRHGRRAYIRSVYFLPSLATLGNAVCGFGAIYVAALDPVRVGPDPLAGFFALHPFSIAAYLIFLAMVFDALDGRLARFTRHTTDFGGQLDSLADAISFGAAPAFLALMVFKHDGPPDLHLTLSRLIWAMGALYMSCAVLRLARFNVSNEHGEQHHFSFLGLPSPGAGATVAALVLMHQELKNNELLTLAAMTAWIIPLLLPAAGLLMISHLRYPHPVNRYLRGRRSFGRLILVLVILLLFVGYPKYTLALGTLAYTLSAPLSWAYLRLRPAKAPPEATG